MKKRGEIVYLRKKHIPIILVTVLLLGFIGSYFGFKFIQPNLQTESNQVETEDKPSAEVNVGLPEDMSKIVQAYDLILDHYIEDVEGEDLLEGAIQGMLDTLEDPYSSYMDPEMVERFNEQIEASFQGIGAEVSMVNGKVTIVAPIKDSPAEGANLRPNDQIITIDGESIEGLDLQEAVEKIRGEKGSEVVLEVERAGVSEPFEVEIIRDDIPLETVYAKVEKVEGKKTGIIEITSFSETTAKDFETEVKEMEKEGIEGLVIDVRGNPGGLLDSVEEILNHFIPKDVPVYQIEDGQGNKQPFYSTLKEEKEYPVNVLIDEGSASASEILAIAMQEIGHDVIGTTSFGKGTVQQAVPLGDGSTIKLTFYKWLSPLGNWVHEEGVKPTIEIKQPDYYYTNPAQVEDPLKLDQTDGKIANIQKMLKGLGYDVTREDGYFNDETAKAVKAFQQDHELETTGIVDQETAGIIESKIIEKIRNRADDLQLKEALDVLYK